MGPRPESRKNPAAIWPDYDPHYYASMGPRPESRKNVLDVPRNHPLIALQWGRDLSLGRTMSLSFQATTQASELQWGRDLSLGRTSREAAPCAHIEGGFNGAET